MSTITRRVIASALALGGVVALNPAMAEAKTADWLAATNPMAPCFGAPGSATGTVSHTGDTGTYTITITGNVQDFEFRARYAYYDATQRKMVFAKDKVANPTGNATTYTGTLTKPGLVIYRLDVVAAEGLVYTSDGPEGCD
jgi:hypothetical protein